MARRQPDRACPRRRAGPPLFRHAAAREAARDGEAPMPEADA